MRIVELLPSDDGLVHEVAALLVEAFASIPDFVKTEKAALAEISTSFGTGRLSRVALDTEGNALGWVGGNSQYGGLVYELHPLAVKRKVQRQGIGRALVGDFEIQAREKGAMTVMLGTDDETGGTNLFGVDVYPDVCSHISSIQNVAYHPFEFYLKCGYVIVGLVPDANGFGKPDILMAKRIVNPVGRSEGARG